MQVGFGDISATNNVERVFCIFIMWAGTAVFATIINGLQTVAQEMSLKHREKEHHLQTVLPLLNLLLRLLLLLLLDIVFPILLLFLLLLLCSCPRPPSTRRLLCL